MFLNKIFDAIEQTGMTLKGWLTALLGIVMIRALLENFVGLRPGSVLTSDIHILLHFFLFWISTTLLLLLVVHFATKKDVITISKISLFGLMGIFFAPIFEFVVSGGQGLQMSYLIVETNRELFSNFATFWHTSPAPGVTLGMRIEIFLILVGLFMYVRHTGLSIIKSVMTILGVYVVVFFTLALPSFVPFDGSYSSVLLMNKSLLGQNLLHPSLQMLDSLLDFEMHFDGVLSQVLYLLLLPLVLLTGFRWNARKVLAIIKNSRPEKVVHFFAAITFGILLTYKEGVATSFTGYWLDITTLIILFASFYFAWMYAVGENDIVDQGSDAISNSGRPLPAGIVTVSEMKSLNIVFLSLSLIGAYLVGPEVLFMVITFIGIYHIYSCPPLHLKRFAIANSFLVALATLTAVLAGFSTFNGAAPIATFPAMWITLIIVLFTFVLNIKDVKDIEGDRRFGIYTIPVLFGKHRGNQIIWALLSLGLIIVPIVLGISLFWYPSIISIILSWFILNKEPFNERYFLYLFLPYFILFVYVMFFS